MIIFFVILGLAIGWLLELAGDYLLRFSRMTVQQPTAILRRPALFDLVAPQVSRRAVDLAFELFTGGVFALIYLLHGSSPETPCMIVIYSFFALIALMDYKYHVILNVLTYPGLVVALVVNLFLLHQPLLNILLGSAFGFIVFYLTMRVKPGGLGGGDVKLAALIGAALGFPNVLWALIVTAAASALAIIFLLTARHGTTKDAIPYAPFLSLGIMVVLMLTIH